MPHQSLLISLSTVLLLAVPGAPASAADPARFVPVFKTNFPDPHVLRHGDEYIAYATNAGINLPMAASTDLVNWSTVMDPASPKKRLDGMPVLAPWVKPGFTWAPEVMELGGKWLLYYTANHRTKDVQCIGLAIADNPRGPFRDSAAEPLVCQFDLGGTIDANPFRDSDGKLYLYYKSDGNRVGKGTAIWGQRLSDDGRSVVGTPVALIKDDQPWEMKLVEAPAMVRAPTGYHLFYSAAYYGWDSKTRLSPYATGYAGCTGPLGPCTDAPENPILYSYLDKKAGCLSGPGHPSIFQVGAHKVIAFHAWAATSSCRKAKDERWMYLAPIVWKDGKPQIARGLRASDKAR
ncbi:MAG TPA: glycoside hydrolase family 43 protein [Allosphingosinicella sp.]|nr:glycoside hydrolase family 43 protein [Allosphingosinicella sp.]